MLPLVIILLASANSYTDSPQLTIHLSNYTYNGLAEYYIPIKIGTPAKNANLLLHTQSKVNSYIVQLDN
jgi:hypothetical protein